MTKYLRYFLFILLPFFLPQLSFANDIAVSSVSVNNVGEVTFTISWANSWHDSVNYDAAWVFMKYSTDSGATWSHAYLANSGTNPGGFSQTGGDVPMDIIVTSDKTGAFVQRQSTGIGDLTSTHAATFQFGLAPPNNVNSPSTTLMRVFAIEMVYVPTGAFYVGDGTNDCSAQAFYPITQITTADASSVGGYPTNQNAPNASWPNGYNAFYIMKYQLSQGQYRDFLNTLTRTQQNNRTSFQTANQYALSYSGSMQFRNGIRCPSSIPGGSTPIVFGCDYNNNGIFNESTDGLWIPCNNLAWPDIAAYTAWAGLRPMTEVEFEKACRGPNYPVAYEYAWGTTDITLAASITNPGTNNEGVAISGNGLANVNTSSLGPIRSGFTAPWSYGNTRVSAGASYWGVMDLSGNLLKVTVVIGETAFIGSHGTGILSSNGNATNSDWPGYGAGEVTGGITGAGWRGGCYFYPTYNAHTSDRAYMNIGNNARFIHIGIRCVRTAGS